MKHAANTANILVTPSTQLTGAEFADASISLSNRYLQAISAAGGLPWVMPYLGEGQEGGIAEMVSRTDGILLTGGDDIQPELYMDPGALTARLRRTVSSPSPERDTAEKRLVLEALKQRKPLLAICRGHQMLNVALGGTLIVDIPLQHPDCLRHNQPNRRFNVVHDILVEPSAHLHEICGSRRLGVNSTHHQAVAKVAEPLQVSARSADGIVEALELKRDAYTGHPYVISVQFHPERLFDRHREYLELFRSFVRAAQRRRKSRYERKGFGRGRRTRGTGSPG
jgi:putative glutamine amidotransferase